MKNILIVAGSYCIGSIPFGLLITYAVKRVDIRTHGSGNIGATNVARVAGKQWGILVFILDFTKGFVVPIVTAAYVQPVSVWLCIAAVVAGVCGHNWPVFLAFKGGKGVATSVGGAVGISCVAAGVWKMLAAGVLVWAVVFMVWRFVSVASLCAAAVFFAVSLAIGVSYEIQIFSGVICLFIFIRHRQNIKRLFSGTEHRFGKKPKART